MTEQPSSALAPRKKCKLHHDAEAKEKVEEETPPAYTPPMETEEELLVDGLVEDPALFCFMSMM